MTHVNVLERVDPYVHSFEVVLLQVGQVLNGNVCIRSGQLGLAAVPLS